MKYNFTVKQLENIHSMLISNDLTPKDIFKKHMKLGKNTSVFTEDVEDFVLAFYAEYRAKFGKNF